MKIEHRILPKGAKYIGVSTRHSASFIVIHESSMGLEPSPADRTIEHYEEQLLNPPVNREKVGYHFMVDDKRVVQFMPANAVTAHCGNVDGNKVSIAIERIVNCNTDQKAAIKLQAKLAATLMHKFGIPLDHVVTHKSWSGKECPARLLAGMYGGWNGFLQLVKKYYLSVDIFDCKEIY